MKLNNLAPIRITVLLLAAATTTLQARDLNHSQKLSADRQLTIKYAVPPDYPRRALRQGIDGEVTLRFTVSRYGRATGIRIVSAQPRKIFDKAALHAVRSWAFDPARLARCGTVEQTAEQTIRFRHQSSPPVQLLPLVTTARQAHPDPEANKARVVPPRPVPLHRVEPVYPEEALRRGIEGVVSVRFDIEADGSVANPVVVDAVKGAVFRGEVFRALRQWRFEARQGDTTAANRTACHEFIFQADEYRRSQPAVTQQH